MYVLQVLVLQVELDLGVHIKVGKSVRQGGMICVSPYGVSCSLRSPISSRGNCQ